MIEALTFSEFTASDQVDAHRKARLALNRNPPSSPPVSSAWLSGTLIRFGHSAGKLRTSGPTTHSDGVGRHNAVRDVFHNIARGCCSLAPIKENPGLLPHRALDDGDPHLPPDPPDPSGRDLCRPADIWVHHGPSGQPEAWDFTICSALCSSIWSRADWDSGTVFQHVESRKSP